MTANPLSVPCPVCHQPAGAPCKNLAAPGARVEMQTAPTTYAHSARYRRAEQTAAARVGPWGAPLIDGITDDARSTRGRV